MNLASGKYSLNCSVVQGICLLKLQDRPRKFREIMEDLGLSKEELTKHLIQLCKKSNKKLIKKTPEVHRVANLDRKLQFRRLTRD